MTRRIASHAKHCWFYWAVQFFTYLLYICTVLCRKNSARQIASHEALPAGSTELCRLLRTYFRFVQFCVKRIAHAESLRVKHWFYWAMQFFTYLLYICTVLCQKNSTRRIASREALVVLSCAVFYVLTVHLYSLLTVMVWQIEKWLIVTSQGVSLYGSFTAKQPVGFRSD